MQKNPKNLLFLLFSLTKNGGHIQKHPIRSKVNKGEKKILRIFISILNPCFGTPWILNYATAHIRVSEW